MGRPLGTAQASRLQLFLSGKAAWFLIGWLAASALSRWRTVNDHESVPYELLRHLAGVNKILNETLDKATSLSLRVDLSRLLHSTKTTLELLRSLFTHHCNGQALSVELLLSADKAVVMRDYVPSQRTNATPKVNRAGTERSCNGPPLDQERCDSPDVIVLDDGGVQDNAPLSLLDQVAHDDKLKGIQIRKFRPQYCKSTSESEYAARLYCIRLATAELLGVRSRAEWYRDAIKEILSKLLRMSPTANVQEFRNHYDELLAYVLGDTGPHPDILPELKSKGILCASAYDIAIDYILLDSFDDLANPPGPVMAVLSGMWFPSTKQRLLETAVWGIIRAKAKVNFGPFKARYYNVMEQLTPFLASGLLELGANPHFTSQCNMFKNLSLEFTHKLFGLVGPQRTVSELADDIHTLSIEYSKRFNDQLDEF